MRTALLAGAFGQHNPGDEALLDAFTQALPDWHLAATSRDVADTTSRHPVTAVPSHATAVLSALHTADAVVVAGGTLFKRLHPSTGRRPDALLASALALAAGARARGVPVALVGVGADAVAGHRTTRTLTRRLVDLADLVVLRDEGSARCLHDAGVRPPFRVGADPAWTVLADQPTQRATAPHATGTLVVLSHLAGGSDDLTAWLAGTIWHLDEDEPVRLLPWQDTAGDLELARRVADLVGPRARVLPPPRDLAEGARVLAGHRQVLAMRLHALLAAATVGTPAVGVGHEPKLTCLAERLDLPVVRVGDGPRRVRAALDRAVASGGADPVRAAAERRRAEETLALLRLYLDGGSPPDARVVPTLDLELAPWPH